MKKLLSILLLAGLCMTAVYADSPAGYAIFGTVPDGYTDLTGEVEVSTTITSTGDAITATDYSSPSTITFTGNGLGGNYVCQNNVAVSIRFKTPQNLTLTDKQAVHITIRRTDENSAGGLEVTMCHAHWGGGSNGRLSFEIANTAVTSSVSELVLKYEETSAKGTWSTTNKTNFVGENKAFTGASTDSQSELFRINAASGEAFEITQIYIAAEEVEIVEAEGKKRFYMFRGDNTSALPVVAETECIDVRPTSHASITNLANLTQDGSVSNYLSFTTNGQYFEFRHTTGAAVTNAIRSHLSDYYLVVRFKTNMEDVGVTGGNLRFNLGDYGGAPNFYINNGAETYNDEAWHTVTLKLSEAMNTLPSPFFAANTNSLQVHENSNAVGSGKYFAIDYAYLTNDISVLDPGSVIDEPAPTAVSVSAEATDWDKVTLTLNATCTISSTVTYDITINGSRQVSTTGTSGVATEFVVDGLSGSTDYTFSVVAKNESHVGAEPVEANATTPAKPAGIEQRYYLTRGNNTDPLPSSASVTSTRVNCTMEYGNIARDTRADEYLSVKTNTTWFSVSFKPTETVENDIDDNWYIVIRFRSNLSNNVYGFNNFRLNLSSSAENWYLNNSDEDKEFGHDYNDGQWTVVKKRIGDRRSGSTVPTTYLAANAIMAQVHVNANLQAGEFFDIDYVYFTNDITNLDAGTQSNRRIVLNDETDNSAILSTYNNAVVDIDLGRSLSNAYYNTLCLPFDMSAEQIEEVFGVGTSIGTLQNAYIKDNDELNLGFTFVDAIEAGVPYLIQPANAVSSALLHTKTLRNQFQPTVIPDVVTFQGVFNPTAIEAQSEDDHTILLVGADNILSWPNADADMNGMRAYFQTTTQVGKTARRASFNFNSVDQSTAIPAIKADERGTKKVLLDGQIYIVREGAVYDLTGTRVK